MIRSAPRGICLVGLLFLAGCGTARFLWQASWGHLEVVSRAEPIERLLRSARAPPGLRGLLREVEPVKRFAARHGLAATDNYQTYAELPRPAVVWSVSACASLAFEAYTWIFPLVGEIPYVGWFDEGAAEAFAEELRAEGWDVAVRPVSAYSTLGWLEDPVLSTMIEPGPAVYGDLANVILHESVHATLYLPDQAIFNESLATFVADRVTPVHLSERFGAGSSELGAYLEAERRRAAERASLAAAYEALAELYASERPEAEKLAQKAEILAELSAAVEARRPLNNANLIDFATYRSGEADFAALLAACANDWERFMASVGSLDSAAFAEPEQEAIDRVLAPLIAAGCAPK